MVQIRSYVLKTTFEEAVFPKVNEMQLVYHSIEIILKKKIIWIPERINWNMNLEAV